MVQNVNPTFVKTPNVQVTQLTTGTTGGSATIYTGGANGSKITSIILTASTTATQDVRLAIVSSAGTIGYFNSVSVATNSGLASTAAAANGFSNCPAAVDSDGNPFLFLASSAQSLNAYLTQSSSIWAANQFIAITVTAGDF